MLAAAAYEPAEHSTRAVLSGQLKPPEKGTKRKIEEKKKCLADNLSITDIMYSHKLKYITNQKIIYKVSTD